MAETPRYDSPLTGAQVDAALLDMAEHNSEAYAVGKRAGSDVPSTDPTYHNNAKYYAELAESVIPGEYTDAVRFDIDQTALKTDAEKSQARANIGATASNRNLLDNWWFGNGVINQRGRTTYGSGVWSEYTIDRWKIVNMSDTDGSATVSSNGITIDKGSQSFVGFRQILENGAPLQNKTVTISAIIDDVLISHSGELIAGDFYDGADVKFHIQMLGDYWAITFQSKKQSAVFKAVKLELGSVSTLANDVAPNYAEELAKCQRYCKVFVPGEHLGIGYARTTTRADVVVSTHLRVLPNATMIGNVILNKADGTSITTTNNTVPEIYGANGGFSLRFYTTGATQSEILRFTINTDSKLILSADL